MSEGPQVKLRTEWLNRYLSGRWLVSCSTTRPELERAAAEATGKCVLRCFCKGKHIFIQLEGGLFFHNHLLMRGKWRRAPGEFLLLPAHGRLALCIGEHTVYNVNGQVLEAVTADEVRGILASLGPDVMARPFPRAAVCDALKANTMPIAEALLKQGVVSGIGNVAKSEILHAARIDPHCPACALSTEQLDALLRALQSVMWDSFRNGGRWTYKVYRRAGKPCLTCRAPIQMLRMAPSRRSIYFCPRCQHNHLQPELFADKP